MATECSFDIVSQFDEQELVNALDQTRKETQTRFDLKDSETEIDFDKANKVIIVLTNNELNMKSVRDILESKAVRRGLSLKVFKYAPMEDASKGRKRQTVNLQQGLSQELAKQISKEIREKYPKVKPQIQGDTIRVIAKSKDELQHIIMYLKQQDYPVPLQTINYRG